MSNENAITSTITVGEIYEGDSAKLMFELPEESIDLSVWSPPYHVGKSYEAGQSLEEWEQMLEAVIAGHSHALKPGKFCVINIADILCFPDEKMPKFQAETISQKRIQLTREEILEGIAKLGTKSRDVLADYFGVSEQTIDRRLNGNNIRGGKYDSQTRVRTVSGMIESMAMRSGLYLYDRRVWVKDAAWANSQWASSSYRAVDEFEYLFFLWKPGITRVDRGRLEKHEWASWGSRAVWQIPSVRANDNHEAKFPIELPSRLIRLLTDPGEVVLDPFTGSGTTQVAAVLNDRNYLGFEIHKEYADLARSNIHKAVLEKQSRLI